MRTLRVTLKRDVLEPCHLISKEMFFFLVCFLVIYLFLSKTAEG